MSKNLKRILTAAIGAPIAVALAYTGGASFAVAVAVVGLVGQMEFYRMAQVAGADPSVGSGLLLGALVVAALSVSSLWGVVLFGVVAYLGIAPFWVTQEHFLTSVSTTLTGAIYPTGLLGSLVLLRDAYVPGGGPRAAFWLVLLVFLLVWSTDIVAYYTGKGLGDRPLAPAISPNKTWEGAAGGFVAAALVAVGAKLSMLPLLSWVDVGFLAVLGGAVSQVGDLVESQFKRSTDTDDASGILPGHGGVLDRFDAMVVAAPLIYLYLHVAGVLG